MTCPVCCVARRDFDLIEVEKPPAFRPLSRTPAQVLYYFFGPSHTFVLCRRLRHVVCREGLLSSTSDSIVNLANGGFVCCCCCCCFSHSAHWLPTRKKLLYTVANPARGLLNREKRKRKSLAAHPPPPPARCSFGEK